MMVRAKVRFTKDVTLSDVISEGELVQMTEKTHGTYVQIGFVPGLGHEDLPGDWFVCSKGLGGKGLVFKNVPENAANLYLRTVEKLGIADALKNLAATHEDTGEQVAIYLMGEIYGLGVQDLAYGLKEPTFAAFDIYFRHANGGHYANADQKRAIFDTLGVKAVNLLYEGPFSVEVMNELRTGKTTMGGDHIREGVVITPLVERNDPLVGRVILKAINADYLTRKGNVTEFA
jgi:RNA ligase (TIGR02306 family)